MKLEYVGEYFPAFPGWPGPCTQMPYPFSKEQRVRYVDKRDADLMMQIKGPNGEELFCALS